MRLEDLGWNRFFEMHFEQEETDGCVPARVSQESKGFYRVLAQEGDFLAQIAGKVRYRAEERSDFPAVGDWVAVVPRPAEARATIVTILPRRTILSRKIAGRAVDTQILATNVDTVLVVASLNQEFNLRRIERYLALAWESGAQPVVLLNKVDLCPDAPTVAAKVEPAAPGAVVHALSAITGDGLEALSHYLAPGRTAAFIGSSGVGKSSIINALLGEGSQRIQPVRASDDRGRHTTTSRQMILLPRGGIVVDTPGMRELQLWESDAGLEQTFEDLEALAQQCRFRDCHHRDEPGCAVAQAIEQGTLDQARLDNYRKLEAELRFLETKTSLNARHTVKQRARQMSKAQKKFYETE